MKVLANIALVVAASLLFCGGAAVARAQGSKDIRSTAKPASIVHVALTGYVREGHFRDPDSGTSMPYIYLELNEPIGKYVSGLKSTENRYKKVELVGGSSTIIKRLKALIGKRVTIRGKLPFTFDANAPKTVLPVVMLMDASNPQLFQ